MSLPSGARADALTQWFLRASLGIALGLVLAMFALSGKDWEILGTKHYWSRGGYYGGYATQLTPTAAGYRTLQSEGLANLVNVAPLTRRRAEGVIEHITGFPGTERLLVPFLAYLVLRVSDGHIELLDGFWWLNVAMWLVAVFAVHRLATIFFDDPRSPLIAALLTAVYPVFTLTFTGIKLQHIGTVFLIVGMFLYESRWQHIAKPWLLLQLTALFSLGLFAAGGWFWLAGYLILRQYWRDKDRVWTIVIVIVAVALARLALASLTVRYRLPSAEAYLQFSYWRMLTDSMAWIAAWWRGEDIAALRLLNYPGNFLYVHFIPIITTAFAKGHTWLLLGAAVAAITCRRARMFLLLAPAMFVLGHSGMAITSWTWHYGYLSAPAGLMLILACSAQLGELSGQGTARRLAALVLLCAMIWQFSGEKAQAGLYWGGYSYTYGARVIVHHEGYDPVVY